MNIVLEPKYYWKDILFIQDLHFGSKFSSMPPITITIPIQDRKT
jgi:hypothetical protein